MSSSTQPFELEWHSLPSSPSPGAAPPVEDGDHDDQKEPGESMRGVRRRLRERARAMGKPFPDSPPRPPPLTEAYPLAMELLAAGGKVIYKKIGSWVVLHGCGTRVTKFDRSGIRPAEVEAMRFVAEHTTIPVPRVCDVGENHLTTERVEGETLAAAWETTLSAEDRALVARQLRGYLEQLRAIKSPDGRIGAFGGRPAVDTGRFFFHEGGPFADEAAFNDFLVSDLAGGAAVRGMIRGQMRDDHEIVLTHGDLHAVNIMARPGAGVVAILDWELAGFYPEYVDLVRLYRHADWTCGYYSELLNIFPRRYDAEWVLEMTRQQWSHH